ncbi:hypothetical protein M8J77_015447 [Diaphorina citri]|nr:hypothetical protein M8J77_015447 [Diaphorina citri]
MDCSVFVLLAAILIALESMAEVEEPREFKADHPFVYAIRDKGVNTILFVGRVKKFYCRLEDHYIPRQSPETLNRWSSLNSPSSHTRSIQLVLIHRTSQVIHSTRSPATLATPTGLPQRIFAVDHPFLVMWLDDNHNIIIYVSRVTDKTQWIGINQIIEDLAFEASVAMFIGLIEDL